MLIIDTSVKYVFKLILIYIMIFRKILLSWILWFICQLYYVLNH